MIKAVFYQNKDNIVGFEIKNHGRDIVCSAVSILSLNTVNSIEAFTDTEYSLDYNVEGGFLKCIINTDKPCESTLLLLKSLKLGLEGIHMEYKKDISINYREV